MLRLAEYGLFLLPFVAFAAWWFLSATLGRRFLWATLAAFLALAILTVTLGLRQHLPPGAPYVPAHMENGRIVPGHAARD